MEDAADLGAAGDRRRQGGVEQEWAVVIDADQQADMGAVAEHDPGDIARLRLQVSLGLGLGAFCGESNADGVDAAGVRAGGEGVEEGLRCGGHHGARLRQGFKLFHPAHDPAPALTAPSQPMVAPLL
jgi:hypothetical protein